jgi:acyl dehydratase
MSEHVGQELDLSEWVAIEQTRIGVFAASTGDLQWM